MLIAIEFFFIDSITFLSLGHRNRGAKHAEQPANQVIRAN